MNILVFKQVENNHTLSQSSHISVMAHADLKMANETPVLIHGIMEA